MWSASDEERFLRDLRQEADYRTAKATKKPSKRRSKRKEADQRWKEKCGPVTVRFDPSVVRKPR